MKQSISDLLHLVENQKVFFVCKDIISYPYIEITSTFASGVATVLVIKISERARPMFKRHPFKSIEDDPEGAFSSIPNGLLYNEYIRAYIHCNIEELGNVDMLSLYIKNMMDSLGNLKLEFKELHDNGFIQFIHFPVFDEPE